MSATGVPWLTMVPEQSIPPLAPPSTSNRTREDGDVNLRRVRIARELRVHGCVVDVGGRVYVRGCVCLCDFAAYLTFFDYQWHLSVG